MRWLNFVATNVWYFCRLAQKCSFFTCKHYQYAILQYHSLAKDGPRWLWNICPPPSLALISFWGLKHIWKSAHLVRALQTGNSHSLGCGETGLHTHTTSCKLHCCTVVYTCTWCLAHNVPHNLHCFYRRRNGGSRGQLPPPTFRSGGHCPPSHQQDLPLFMTNIPRRSLE